MTLAMNGSCCLPAACLSITPNLDCFTASGGAHHVSASMPLPFRRPIAPSLVLLSLVFSLGCEEGPPPEQSLSLRVSVQGEVPSGAVPAVAWTHDGGGWLPTSSVWHLEGTLRNGEPSRLTHDGWPNATLQLGAFSDAERPELSIGHVVVVADTLNELPRLDTWPGVRSSWGSEQRVFWCPPGDIDAEWDEERCYRETYECSSPDCICPGDGCSLRASEGDPRYQHPWGLAEGIAPDWLVYYAHEDIPEEQMRTVGYGGRLEKGYHLIHVRPLEGKALDASHACWSRTVDEALAALNAAHRTDYRTAEDFWDQASGDLHWAELTRNVEADGLTKNKCPLLHLSFEEVDATTSTVEIVADPTLDSTFDLDRLPMWVGNASRRFDPTWEVLSTSP